MYISLFCGRTDPNQRMDDWGTYGPIIGPVRFAMTYNTRKVLSEDGDLEFFQMYDDLIYFDGVFYGDMELIDDHDTILRAVINRERLIDFELFKKINNEKLLRDTLVNTSTGISSRD